MSIKRQFFWSAAPLLSITLVSLISVPLFLRYLGEEKYALWFYVVTFSGMFGFADLGLGVAVGRYIGVALGRNDHSAIEEYWGTANLIAIPLLVLMSLVFVGLGIMFGPDWFNVAPENERLLRDCFVAGGLSLFVNYYAQFWNILSQAYLEFKFIGVLRVGMTLFQTILSVIVAWYTRNPLLIIVWGIVAGALQLALYIWHARKRFNLGLALGSARLARAREMSSYTGKSFVMLMVGSVMASVDRAILGRLASPSEFAHYTVAANVGTRVHGLGGAIMGPVFHNTSRAVGSGSSDRGAKIYDETFAFVFGWYVLAVVWSALWHPIFLRLWLGADIGAKVAPVFTPIVMAFCLAAVGQISSAQLGALNRVGTVLGFTIGAGTLAVIGVWVGWRMGGVAGAAWGFLISRLAFVAQDIFTIRLLKAGGWLSARTWLGVLAQILIAALFASAYLFLSRESTWLIVPAILHVSLIAGWLLRQPIRKTFAGALAVRPWRTSIPAPRTPEP